jgi:UDP-glucose 4-epimerase
MKRIVVTGVAGFIGSNLASKLLASGYEVIGVDNLSSGTRANVPAQVKFHELDIRGPEIYELLKGADAVFHLAAKTNLPDCLKNPVAASDVNVTGTANVLEAAAQAKVGKLIYADTSAEYEGIPELPTKPDRVCPLSAYAVSKHGGALFCEVYQRYFNLNITVVRYFNVYGPAQDWRRVFPPVISSFTTKLLRGEQPTIYGTGGKRRDFIYVDDVNDFHLMLLQDPASDGKIYNVGSGTSYSVVEIYQLIESKLKTGLQPKFAPDLPGEADATLADISENLKLGWRPRIDIHDGLQRAIDFYRAKIRAEAEGVKSGQ